MNLNPKVALLSMVKTKLEARQAIVNACEQSYKLIHLYLIYQNETEEIKGVPIPVTSGMVTVGKDARNEFWWKKMDWFLANCKEDWVAIFDVDDRYEYKYIEKAVAALSDDCAGSWNHAQITVTDSGFRHSMYPTAYGTMLIRTDVLRDAYKVIEVKNDCHLKNELVLNYSLNEHNGMRYYFWTEDMHSSVLQSVREHCIKEFVNG